MSQSASRDGGESVVRASLWIRPEGTTQQQLQTLIQRLSQRYDRTPPKPHVSLLGGIALPMDEACQRLAQLAQRITPFTIRLGALAGRDEPFRAFYALAEPLEELWAAHRAAREIFGVDPGDDFEPHLSLLYGALDPTTLQLLREELGGQLELEFAATGVHLVNACADVPVSQWRSLHVCAFGGSSALTPPAFAAAPALLPEARG